MLYYFKKSKNTTETHTQKLFEEIVIENDFNLEGGKRDPKGDQFWVFIGRTDAEAEIPILWPPHAKS